MDGCRVRVLLVEDDEDDYLLTRRMLAKIPGVDFEVERATDFDSALGAIVEDRHDIILTDYNLGGRDGLELIREAIARGSTAALILQTGESDRTVDVAAMDAGATDFLVKGLIDPALLDRSLRYALHRKRAGDRLRASEAEARKLALVASRTDNAVIITDARGRIEWVNDGFTRITEYTLDEVIGKKPGSFLQGPETDAATVAHMRERLAAGEGFRSEILNYSKSGRPYWLLADVQPIRDDDGRLLRFIAIESDVTERKRTERELKRLSDEALRASQERLRSVVTGAPIILFALDRDGRFTLSEGRGLAEMGLISGEVVGHSVFELYRDQTRMLADIRRALTGEVLESAVREAGRDLQIRFSPLRDEHGAVGGVIGVATDMTDLRKAEAKYRAIFENALEGIFQTTPDGRYLCANPALARIYGYESPEALMGDLTDIERQLYVEPGRRDEFVRLLRAHGVVTDFESAVYRKDRRVIWISERARIVRDDEGTVSYFEGSVQDITERKSAEEEIRGLNVQLERRLERIAALHRIDLAITASPDLEPTLEIVLDQVRTHLRVDAAAVLLCGTAPRTLRYAAGQGFRTGAISRSCLRFGEGLAGRAALDGCPVGVDDLADCKESLSRGHLIVGEGFVAYHAVPLVVKGEVKGVLEVFQRAPIGPDPEWLGFLEALAGRAAVAVDNSALFLDLQRTNAELTLAYDATIEGWSRALDLRDKETEGHTRRVTEMTVRLAAAMGIGGAEMVHIRRGALLHDIGKMGIPDAILLKAGKLDRAEREVMERHPTYAHQWLVSIPYLHPALEIPHCHHERWDGTGYPRGLRGEEIPLAARLFAVVDVWDALRSDRPYRKAWSEVKVREYLREQAGSHLDLKAVTVFLQLLASDDVPLASVPGGAAEDGPHRPTIALPLTADGEGEHDSGLLRRAVARNRSLERQHQELARDHARLAARSTTDDLTGLKNRRHFREALESAFSFAIRQGQPLSVVMLDLDHLRRYNDSHGRPAGDEAIRTVARSICANVRPHDVVARYGAEEFAILLAATDAEGARIFADRLRDLLAGHDWPHGPVTVSLGIASMPPDLLSAIELVEEAERALGQCKQLGRDRVLHANDLAVATQRQMAYPA